MLARLEKRCLTTKQILSEALIHNAMTVHAAVGGSTNLLLHIPAIAYSAGLPRPTIDDWHAINLRVPRIVDVLPNGPVGHPTVRCFLGGRRTRDHAASTPLGLLQLDALLSPASHSTACWTGGRPRHVGDNCGSYSTSVMALIPMM